MNKSFLSVKKVGFEEGSVSGMRRKLALFAALMVFLALAMVQCLAIDPINKKRGVAIRGYDPVAFFTESRAVEGDKQYTHRWMNAEWRFISAENRDLFAADPEKYAPQYGGYCAYAASQGRIYDANPKFWKIVDGKLYLNYNGTAQQRWEKELPKNIAKAAQLWPQLIQN